MRRPQFTLRALLILMLAIACFFGGMALQRQLDSPRSRYTIGFDVVDRRHLTETMVLQDGTEWHRSWDEQK